MTHWRSHITQTFVHICGLNRMKNLYSFFIGFSGLRDQNLRAEVTINAWHCCGAYTRQLRLVGAEAGYLYCFALSVEKSLSTLNLTNILIFSPFNLFLKFVVKCVLSYIDIQPLLCLFLYNQIVFKSQKTSNMKDSKKLIHKVRLWFHILFLSTCYDNDLLKSYCVVLFLLIPLERSAGLLVCFLDLRWNFILFHAVIYQLIG